MSIIDQYYNIQKELKIKLNSISRDENEVELIAVSKKQPTEKIIRLLDLGHRSFGENQIQEIDNKWPQLKTRFDNIRLHFIGSIQSNKIKKICSLCDVIHSIDREKIIKSIADLKLEGLKMPELFIQVNIGQEQQKSGLLPNEVSDFIYLCKNTHNITISGLMCLPPIDQDAKYFFEKLNTLANKNKINKLSMGMSNDYLQAIEAGSTHLRIGTSIFGDRV